MEDTTVRVGNRLLAAVPPPEAVAVVASSRVAGPVALPAELPELMDLDTRLVAAAREIKILSHLAWPPETATDFFAAGKRAIPACPLSPPRN